MKETMKETLGRPFTVQTISPANLTPALVEQLNNIQRANPDNVAADDPLALLIEDDPESPLYPRHRVPHLIYVAFGQQGPVSMVVASLMSNWPMAPDDQKYAVVQLVGAATDKGHQRQGTMRSIIGHIAAHLPDDLKDALQKEIETKNENPELVKTMEQLEHPVVMFETLGQPDRQGNLTGLPAMAVHEMLIRGWNPASEASRTMTCGAVEVVLTEISDSTYEVVTTNKTQRTANVNLWSIPPHNEFPIRVINKGVVQFKTNLPSGVLIDGVRRKLPEKQVRNKLCLDEKDALGIWGANLKPNIIPTFVKAVETTIDRRLVLDRTSAVGVVLAK